MNKITFLFFILFAFAAGAAPEIDSGDFPPLGKSTMTDREFNASVGQWLDRLGQDFQVLGLAREWAVLGSPALHCGWILSRTSPMTLTDLSAAIQTLTSTGYGLCQPANHL